MDKQQTFAGLARRQKKKLTRRDGCLAKMNPMIPWTELQALIAAHSPTAGRGRSPMPFPGTRRAPPPPTSSPVEHHLGLPQRHILRMPTYSKLPQPI